MIALILASIFDPFSEGIDYRRQSLTSVDIKYCRLWKVYARSDREKYL